MDYDGDGMLDLISGSYDPGEIYLFRGLGGGKFKARETIVDRSGRPIIRHHDQKVHWQSFGSWVALVDWDNDGDLDMVLGGFDGSIKVRLNEGTRTQPAYATTSFPVQVDGKDLMIPGHHATPVIADWDGDGLWDILTGSDNGGVYWYRNIGKLGAPRFAQPVTLVPPHQGSGYNEFLDVSEEPKPGIRSQIAVVDYNGDGKLDLLLGDFCTNVSPRKNLTPAQRSEMLTLRRQMAATEAGDSSPSNSLGAWGTVLRSERAARSYDTTGATEFANRGKHVGKVANSFAMAQMRRASPTRSRLAVILDGLTFRPLQPRAVPCV